jgi:VWFA-related protein
MRIAAALLTLGLLGVADTPQPTYLDTLEVRITNLDVIVTDRSGVPVRGLPRDAFEVRENGVVQPITNFSEFGVSSGSAEATGEAKAVQVVSPAAETAPPRKILFFIDDMSIHPLDRRKLLGQARKFIAANLRDGDEMAVIAPATKEKLLLAFTSDRAAIDAQVADLINHSTFGLHAGYDLEKFQYDTTVARAQDENERREMARIYAQRVTRRVNGTLRSLLGFVGSMTEVPGKKVIVVMSASLTAEPGREAFTLEQSLSGIDPSAGVVQRLHVAGDPFDYDRGPGSSADTFAGNFTGKELWGDARPLIREVAATAAGNGITIYSLQPDLGVRPSFGGSADSPAPGVARGRFATRRTPGVGIESFQREVLEGTATTLGTLADLTGGKYFKGGSQMGNAFRQLTSDVGSYYSIGYRAPQGTNDTFRKIAVVVKGRPELSVRTRSELMRLSPGRAMDELVASTLYMPREVNELGVVASAERPKRELDHYNVDIVVKLPLEKLTFVPVADDMYRATFSVHYAAADGADYATGAARQQTLQAKSAELDEVRKKTFTYTTKLTIAPGTARIAVGVVDELSRLSSLQRLMVEAK